MNLSRLLCHFTGHSWREVTDERPDFAVRMVDVSGLIDRPPLEMSSRVYECETCGAIVRTGGGYFPYLNVPNFERLKTDPDDGRQYWDAWDPDQSLIRFYHRNERIKLQKIKKRMFDREQGRNR